MANVKSAAGKRLRGETRPSRVGNKQEPASPPREPSPPDPPTDLIGLGAEIWRELAPDCWRGGLLTPTDHRAFGLLCATLATERQARAELDRDGLVTKTDAGSLKPHPSVRTAEQARVMAVRLMGQFGMTPMSRSRVDRAPDPAAHSPWLDEFGEFG